MRTAWYYRCRLCASVIVSVIAPIKGWPEQCNGCRSVLRSDFIETVSEDEYQRLMAKGGKEARYAPSQPPALWHCLQCQQIQPADQAPVYHLGQKFCTVEHKEAWMAESRASAFPYTNDKERRERLRQLELEHEALMLGRQES